MKDKQTTLKEVLKKIIKSECISCGEDLKKTLKKNWTVPLCSKCRLEAKEDLVEYS